jgi:hypothetical protein
MCWTPLYTRHRTTKNKTNNTTLYALDTTIHKTPTHIVVLFVLFVIDLCLVYVCLVYGCVQHILCCVIYLACRRPVSCVWLCPTNIVLCYLSCLSSSCVLCMVVSNTYSVVLFVLHIVALCLVYGCVQHI